MGGSGERRGNDMDMVKIQKTRHGLRLSQHGVVLSELRTTAGPTHSVFDVLAALVAGLAPTGRVGVLGFAGGGVMAPLRALGHEGRIDSCDLDRAGYDLFCRHCREWASQVRWRRADAVAWLRGQPSGFRLLVEDLSVPSGGDVTKPLVSWEVMPGLMRSKLAPDGVAVFNLLRPQHATWARAMAGVTEGFAEARVLELEEYENRILVAGAELPTARDLGRQMREALARIRSRQATRVRARRWD